MELDNTIVTIVGASNTSDRVNMNGDVVLTLKNGSKIADVRDMDIASGINLTLNVDETSSIHVQYPVIAEDVPFEKVDNGDGTYGIAEVTKEISGNLGTVYVQAANTTSNNTDRNRLYGEIKNVYAKESVVVKVYSGETLISTTNLTDKYTFPYEAATLGVNVVISGSTSSSWNTVWEEGMPRADLVPDKAVLYIDDTEMDTATVTLNGIDNLGTPTVWETLPGVNPDPNAPVIYEVSTKAELDAALAAAKDGDTIKLLADIDCGSAGLKIEDAITLDLGGKTLTTSGRNYSLSLHNDGIIVTNGKLVHAGTVAAIKVYSAAEISNLDIDVTGTSSSGNAIGGIVIQQNSAGVDTIKNVNIYSTAGQGIANGIETHNCGNATEPVIGSMENVTVNAKGNALNISAPCGTAKNCSFTGGESGIEIWIKGTYSATLDLVDCDVTGGKQAIYAHDEFSSDPNIVNNGTLKLTMDEATTLAGPTLLKKEIVRAENVTLPEIKEPISGTITEDMVWSEENGDIVGNVTISGNVTITVIGEVPVVGTIRLSPDSISNVTFKGENGAKLIRSGDFTGQMFYAEGVSDNFQNLTFNNIKLDGGAVWTGDVDKTLNRGTVNSGVKATGSVLYLVRANAVLNNSTLQNHDDSTGEKANAVFLRYYSTIEFNGSVVANNNSISTYYRGGVVTIRQGGTVKTNNAEVYGNSGAKGGFYGTSSTGSYGGVVEVYNSKFHNNYATDGAVFDMQCNSNRGYLKIDGCEFYNNASNRGLIYEHAYSRPVIISDSKFYDNECAVWDCHADPVLDISGKIVVAEDADYTKYLFETPLVLTGALAEGSSIAMSEASINKLMAAGYIVTGTDDYTVTESDLAKFVLPGGYKLAKLDANGDGINDYIAAKEDATFVEVTVYDNFNGNNVSETQSLPADVKTLPALNFVHEGAEFLGWMTAADGTEVIAPQNFTEKTTLYAKWKSYVAQIGETKYETLADAVTAAESGATIILMPGTHKLESAFADKELTFTSQEGKKAETVMQDAYNNYYQFQNTKFHFENLTITGDVTVNEGLHHSVEATYKNCDINGIRYLFSENVSFEDCVFNSTGEEHAFWTYGASNITVTGCTFNYTDRAVNCYSEAGAEHETDITFTDCTFNYTGTSDASEGVVEINSSSSKSIDLVMNGCTAPAKGDMWFISQWDNKDGANTTVYVDSVKVWPVKPVAMVGTTEYGTIEEAIAAWTNGTTLTLLANVTLSDVIVLKSTEYHILDLGTYTMTAASKKDAIQIENCGRGSASWTLDIKADATNPGGITATGKAIVRTAGKSGVKDRPIIRFYGGVFKASYIAYHTGSNGTNCPQFYFYGGDYTGTIYTNRTLNQFHGGTFHGSLMMSVDSSAYTLINGGTFKQLSNLYMSALNSGKFTIGSAKGTYDREVYINDDGYYVVAAAKPAEAFEAAIAKNPGTNDYLKYSKVAAEGKLNYTDVYVALDQNKSASVIVYVDSLDLTGTSFKGTLLLPAADSTLTVTFAEGTTPAWKVDTELEGYVATYTESVADGTVTRVYKLVKPVAQIGETLYESLADAAKDIATDGSDTTIKILCDIEVPDSIVFNYGSGNVIFEADEPVTIKQTAAGKDFDFTVGKTNQIIIGKNVTFEIYDNAGGLYVYYGPSLVLDGTITGGQNWGVAYLYDGSHVVSETGKLGTGRVQIGGDADLTVKGEVDTNYLLVEGSAFTADGATVDATVIYDNNNGGQRWGASTFDIKNDSTVTTSKLTLSYADTVLTIDGTSSITAGTIEGAGKIVIDATNLTAGPAPISGDASGFTGTIEVVGNDELYAAIDENGNIVLIQKVFVAQIGETKYETFEAAIAAACADSTITRIDILCDYTQDTIAVPGETYTMLAGQNLTIGADKAVTVTLSRTAGESFSIYLYEGNSSLTIEENVTIEGLDIVANGFATSGNNTTINGVIKALSLKQWTSNGTITVSETGKVELGYGDGQFDLAYGNGTVTVNGKGDKTAPQFKAGYSGSRGNGNTLNLNNTYFESGAWFTLNGSNVTVNLNNSLLAVSGGDAAGYLTIGAGNVVNVGAGSEIKAGTINGAGKIVIDAADMTAGEVTIITG